MNGTQWLTVKNICLYNHSSSFNIISQSIFRSEMRFGLSDTHMRRVHCSIHCGGRLNLSFFLNYIYGIQRMLEMFRDFCLSSGTFVLQRNTSSYENRNVFSPSKCLCVSSQVFSTHLFKRYIYHINQYQQIEHMVYPLWKDIPTMWRHRPMLGMVTPNRIQY